MKVKLVTRCGCSREMQTTYPPPREIMVSLIGSQTVSQELRPGALLEVRPFRLEVFVNQGPDASVAEYREWYTR